MFRKNQNKICSGLLFYENQDLNYKIVNTYNFPIKLALTKRKLFILGLYKTPSNALKITILKFH